MEKRFIPVGTGNTNPRCPVLRYRPVHPRGHGEHMQDSMEWHAEHFTAWALNRDMLASHYPDIAEYFDKLMEQLLP